MSGRANDIIVMGTHPFVAGVPLGDWHLARALARGRRVLWVDPPASPLAPRRGAASTAMFRPRPMPAGDGLRVGSPIVHSGRLRPAHAAAVDRVVGIQIRRWMRQLDMHEPDVITFSPRFGALACVPHRTVTLWLKDRDWASHGMCHAEWLRTRAEHVAKTADVVVVVSEALVADCRSFGVDALRIPNGCDVTHYGQPRREPAALKDLGRPRVVFSGAWNWRVDHDLVAAAAAHLPEFAFVLVGAVAAPPPQAPNVHSLGPVPYPELPAYLQHTDVGIVPYRRDDFNEASCPLKLYEYLAAGIPAVVTGVDTAELPGDVVRDVDDLHGLVTALRRLASRDVAASCRSLAACHSWEARADTLLDAIDRAAHQKFLTTSGIAT